MTAHPHFIDDVRTVVFFNAEDGSPTRAVLDLPTGTIECGLVRLDGSEWARLGLTVQHRVVHVDERAPALPPAPPPTAQGWLVPSGLALAAFVVAACSGAFIASAAVVLSQL